MFFNPDDGKTWEEICELAFRGMKPEHRARLEAEARAAGCSVHDVMDACVARHLDDWKTLLPHLDWEQQPYGKDPLLTQMEP